jgi:hypothetical protein
MVVEALFGIAVLVWLIIIAFTLVGEDHPTLEIEFTSGDKTSVPLPQGVEFQQTGANKLTLTQDGENLTYTEVEDYQLVE